MPSLRPYPQRYTDWPPSRSALSRLFPDGLFPPKVTTGLLRHRPAPPCALTPLNDRLAEPLTRPMVLYDRAIYRREPQSHVPRARACREVPRRGRSRLGTPQTHTDGQHRADPSSGARGRDCTHEQPCSSDDQDGHRAGPSTPWEQALWSCASRSSPPPLWVRPRGGHTRPPDPTSDR